MKWLIIAIIAVLAYAFARKRKPSKSAKYGVYATHPASFSLLEITAA